MTSSALTISFWVIYVWLCRDSTDFFSAYLSGRAVYVWLCRDFDFHTEQCSGDNRCRARSNIFIGVLVNFQLNGSLMEMIFLPDPKQHSQNLLNLHFPSVPSILVVPMSFGIMSSFQYRYLSIKIHLREFATQKASLSVKLQKQIIANAIQRVFF